MWQFPTLGCSPLTYFGTCCFIGCFVHFSRCHCIGKASWPLRKSTVKSFCKNFTCTILHDLRARLLALLSYIYLHNVKNMPKKFFQCLKWLVLSVNRFLEKKQMSQTLGLGLYLIFPVIVIVISAMFTFQFCPKLHYDHDKKNSIHCPSFKHLFAKAHHLLTY